MTERTTGKIKIVKYGKIEKAKAFQRVLLLMFMAQTEAGVKEASFVPATAAIGFVVLKCQAVRNRLNNLFCYEPVILIGTTALTVHLIHHFYQRVPNDGTILFITPSLYCISQSVVQHQLISTIY